MSRYLFWRILQAVLSLLAVAVIVFVLARLTGDPTRLLLAEDATPEMRLQLRERLGLDQPILVQFGRYMGDLVRGDLGTSMRGSERSVAAMIVERLPATFELGGAAFLLSVVLGILLGIYSGYWRGGWFDRMSRAWAVLGQAAPTFWVGILLILVVSVKLRWLPTGGRGGLDHLVLPAVTMAWASIAGVMRLMRSSLLETLEMDYIRLCRIKGLPERTVLWKHGLRNAALPVLTFGGVLAAGLVTGSVVTESVFVWPGTGRLLIDAVNSRDYPVVQGVVLFLTIVYIVVSLVVDALYAYLNPRLRVEG